MIILTINIKFGRGTLVKWLEWLGYGAENHRKVVSLRPGFAM